MSSTQGTDENRRLLRTLKGETMWPPPIWLMRQAGRFLPEFRALREKADFLTRCMTPDLATEITLQPIRRFAMDGAILFSDILILPWAMGQSLQFIDKRGPVLEPIRSEADMARLDPARIEERTAPVAETLRRVRKALGEQVGAAAPDTVTLIGFAGAPFTVSCYMVDGGSSKEFAQTRLMAFREPALFDRLINLLMETTASMLADQIEAGAQAVMLFDSWSGLLPPHEFRRHVINPTRQIVQSLKSRYPDVPVIGFPRLAGVMAPEYARETGVDAMALDTGADLTTIASQVRSDLVLQGNLDPVAVLAGGKAMIREALAIREAGKGRPHVFNLGHGVLPETPTEHVGELIAALRTV